METIFRIEENRNKQRILLIDDEFHVFKHIPINYDEFDGMMFLSENGNLVEQQFLHLNPLTERSTYLKPFFINPNILNASFLKCAADGLSSDLNEPSVITKIENIKEQIKTLNIETSGEELIKGEKTVLISIFRFFLSRGGIPDAILKKGSTLGYCICFYEFFMRHDILSFQSILLIYEEYIKNSYIKYLDIIDVVQYCPYCNHTHIIYTEICPKCSSCNIELNNMLHHYPCANISDEKSYMIKGDLVCPKCQKNLHHIGVDYDRPASIYNCTNCNTSFSRSDMRGTCVSCEKVMSLDEFRLYKICSLGFTTLGVKNIAQWSIYSSNEDVSVSIGFLSVNSFVEYLTNEIEIYNLSTNKNNLTTIRVQGVSLLKVEEFSKFIFDNILNAKCTFKDSCIYISLTYTEDGIIDDYAQRLDDYAQKMELKEYIGVDYANYVTTITIKDYFKQIF